jgi:hypothetical protein
VARREQAARRASTSASVRRRRAAGVQRLGHRTERRLQPRGFASREADRAQPAVLVQAEEMGTGRSRAERPDGTGRVEPDLVVPATEKRSKPALELDAGDQRGEEPTSVRVLRLGEREERGQHGR